METKGFVLNDSLIKLETTGFEALAAAGMATVEDGHVVFLSHGVDGIEEAEEVLLRVDVFLTMRTEQYVLLRR